MKDNSTLFLAITFCLMLSLNVVIIYVYITKQKRNIAIMRMLGCKKEAIAKSICHSLIVVALIGCFLGGFVGSVTAGKMNHNAISKQLNEMNVKERDEILESQYLAGSNLPVVNFGITIIIIGMQILLLIFLARIQLKKILSQESIRLLE